MHECMHAGLDDWERTFNNARSKGKSFSAPGGPWKAALLSGPPGIGKSTTATLVAREAGRAILELNASDTRSKKSLQEGLGDVTGSQVLNFGGGGGKSSASSRNTKPTVQRRCIIMDEVDGMGAGDRSGMAELIQMIKHSMVPIVCICNDRQSQKIRSLVPYCLDLRYRRPVKSVIGRRAVEVGAIEGMHVEANAAEAIAESCGNDIRQVLNVMQMWSSKKNAKTGQSSDITYRELKQRQHEINKDDMLRVSLFDATRMIVEGPRNVQVGDPKSAKDSLYKRTDAFFTVSDVVRLSVLNVA
jgi:replication factor C subunit 1